MASPARSCTRRRAGGRRSCRCRPAHGRGGQRPHAPRARVFLRLLIFHRKRAGEATGLHGDGDGGDGNATRRQVGSCASAGLRAHGREAGSARGWAGRQGGSEAPAPRPSTSPVSAGPTSELAAAAKQEGERGGKLESPFPPRARPLGRMWLVRGTGQREPAVVRADAINDSWGCMYTAHAPPIRRRRQHACMD